MLTKICPETRKSVAISYTSFLRHSIGAGNLTKNHHLSGYTRAVLGFSVVVANGGMVREETNDSVIDSQPTAGALPPVCADESGLTLYSIRRALTEAAL